MFKRKVKKVQKQQKEKKKRKPQWGLFFDKVRHFFSLTPKSDRIVTLAVLLLVLCGTVMIISTNVGGTTSNANIVLTTTIRQVVYLVISFLFMWAANHIFNFKWFSKAQNMILIFAFIFMLMPLAFAASGGSHAWIRLPGGVTIQPAEFAKPLLILVFATSLYQARKDASMTRHWQILFRKPFICWAMLMVGIVLQHDYGTGFIISFIFFICLMIPAYPQMETFQKWLRRIIGTVFIVALVLFWVTDIGTSILSNTPLAHIATRIENAKNPYTDVYGSGYQPANALYGIGSGGLFGRGIGGSLRKYGYLTQADNDYILAVIIEETGIFGLGILSLLYGLLIYRFFYYAFKTNEFTYKTVLVGSSAYLFIHFVLNVGGVSGLIPSTGVPLLFISSGGSSLMAAFITIGLCQQCISQIRLKEMKSNAYRIR